MKITSIINTALLLAMVAGVSACKKPEEPIGPAQKAGAAIDNAGQQVGEQLKENIDKADAAAKAMASSTRERLEQANEDASKGLATATENVGKKVEEAGERIQEAAKK